MKAERDFTKSSLKRASSFNNFPPFFFSSPSKDWPLKIKYVQLRDAGLYECQVSSGVEAVRFDGKLNFAFLVYVGDETSSDINFYSAERCWWVFRNCYGFGWKSSNLISHSAHRPIVLEINNSLFLFFLLRRPTIRPHANEHDTEARAEISGPSEKYLKPGSVLRLTCRVVENIENPLYIFWYHNNRMINYDSHRGVNVSTEPGLMMIRAMAGVTADRSGLPSLYLWWFPMWHQMEIKPFFHSLRLSKNTKSKRFQFAACLKRSFFISCFYARHSETDNRYSELQISQTTTSHSGNYSCVTNNAVSSSTFVHIFNGEFIVSIERST